MSAREIPTSLGTVSGLWTPSKHPECALILAHGAGTDMRHPGMEALADALAATGCTVLRFNFLYTEQGKGRPDRAPALLQVWREVLAWARRQPETRSLPIFCGGRSMGGRMASMAAAEHGPGTEFDPAGLIFFAYPLHPPGRTDALRTAHLARIRPPMLFLSGTRDSMAQPDLMESAIAGLSPRAQLYWLQDADHSYKVLKRSGRTFDDVLTEAAETAAGWRGRVTL